MHAPVIALAVLPLLILAAGAAEPTVGEAAFIEHIGRECTVIPLWPEGSPQAASRSDVVEAVVTGKDGWANIRPVARPSMTIVPPPAGVRKTGVAVLCCPGGAYRLLSTGNVVQLTQWLNAMGATAVLLKYRLSRDHNTPLEDAQRATAMLRSRAAEFGIDPAKIIIAGSSAGGHLAFNLSANHGERVYEPVDEHDRASCRPDATILFYPAYLTKTGSLTPTALLDKGKLASAKLPPVFITGTRPDRHIVGSLAALHELRKAKVPVELHVYPTGGHGGMFNKYPLMEFARPCARFLVDKGLFTKEMRAAGDAWLDRQVPKTKAKIFPDLAKTRPGPSSVPTAAPNLGRSGVPETDLTEGERAIRKVTGKELPVFRLWPDRKPSKPEDVTYRGGIMRIAKVTAPSITVFRPAKADGRAVLVFPGGGYGILAGDHEGVKVCEWLRGLGVTAFLVKYTVPRPKGAPKHSAALPDALEAIRLVRSGAERFGVDPGKVGVLGFSAGGHLIALTCHAKDAESRPDFAIPIYPAYTVVNRDGSEIDPPLAEPDPKTMPQIFIAIAADDPFRPGAVHWFHRLEERSVAAELHVYERGGHGKGLREQGYPFSEWTKACERWLRDLETVAPY
ncbi:MAG: alpha/beta hydrolase [Planctomycetota bacterium]|jgi:acetyl esterase/lipase